MRTIYLMRHGKASLDRADRERGLTTEGQIQAEQLANQLETISPPIQSICASPFQRAVLFIKPFANRLKLGVDEIENLREITLSSEKIPNINEARKNLWSDFSVKLSVW